MAQCSAVRILDSITGLHGQLLNPLAARLVERLLMIQMQVCQLCSSVRTRKSGVKSVLACSAIDPPDTMQRHVGEARSHKRGPVVPVCVLHKVLPNLGPGLVAHAAREARCRCTHKSTPPLLCSPNVESPGDVRVSEGERELRRRFAQLALGVVFEAIA